MGFAVNQVIGNYECLGIIEKPRAGVTYKVRNLATGEIEALRALPGSSSRDPESVERLLREIRVQARLAHPNIIAFHDAFEIDGRLVMAMEFIEAPTVAELCREGPLPPSEAIRTILQVLDALEEAHALGIVHRGITAEHVLVAPGGAVKLGGFDLAKSASEANLTRVGTLAGDPRYVSPEQVTGQAALDGRSDLYSIGVLLYQMLTGKLPFEAPNDFEILAAHVGSEPRPPSTQNPAISRELDWIVLKALKKNPDDRFPKAEEFRSELAAAGNATQAVPSVATGHDPVSPHPAAPKKPQRSLRVPLVIGLLVLTIILAVVSWVAAH